MEISSILAMGSPGDSCYNFGAAVAYKDSKFDWGSANTQADSCYSS